MATAYSTFASNGIKHETHSISKVTQGTEDEEVYKPETKGKRVFDKAVMAETSYALQQVVNGGSGGYAANLGRPAAGKTGTTTDNTAAWFSGYTPNLATSVVLYREVDNKQKSIGAYGGRGQVTGGSFPAQVWTDYMQQALEGEKVVQFPERGELPEKPKPKNTNAPAPPPQPKAPSENGSDNGGDGGDTKTKAPIDTPSEKPKDDEDKDKADRFEGQKPTKTGRTTTARNTPTATSTPRMTDEDGSDGSDGSDNENGGDDNGDTRKMQSMERSQHKFQFQPISTRILSHQILRMKMTVISGSGN